MDALAQESLALRARYDEEPSHSDHVAKLALQIFDGLSSWHKLSPRARELLHSAAVLHDIGWSQTPDGRGHHKWSARLIQEYSWKNLTPDEVRLVALIARYHRKVPPKPEHSDFHALKRTAQKSVMILGGILRIADALDRTHSGKITRVEVSAEKKPSWLKFNPRERGMPSAPCSTSSATCSSWQQNGRCAARPRPRINEVQIRRLPQP